MAYDAQPDDLAFLDSAEQNEPDQSVPVPTPPIQRGESKEREDLRLSQLEQPPFQQDAEIRQRFDALSPVAKSVLRDPRPSAASVTDFRLKFYD